MKLIGSDTSPYVRKVRVVMAEKRIEYRYERHDPWAPGSPVQDTNPLCKVPALLLDDGTPIYDSTVIVEYLDQLTPVHRLIPDSGRQRAIVRTWEALADGLLDAAVALRVENTQREPAQRSRPWMARQMDKIEAALRQMDRGMAADGWCHEGRFSLADIAVGCALGYLDFRLPALGWRQQFPRVERLAGELFRRESFVATVPA